MGLTLPVHRPRTPFSFLEKVVDTFQPARQVIKAARSSQTLDGKTCPPKEQINGDRLLPVLAICVPVYLSPERHRFPMKNFLVATLAEARCQR